MSLRPTSSCPHVDMLGQTAWEDVFRKKAAQESCETCSLLGPNLWLCLHYPCLYVGCGEAGMDHSTEHYVKTEHCLTVNLTTMRIWCYRCGSEVLRDGNTPKFALKEKNRSSSHQHTPLISRQDSQKASMDDSDCSDDVDDEDKPRGLTGLQNIGNTCYINAAIQALSNCQPLTRFFLDCPGFVQTDQKPMLSRCYLRLVAELWHKKRPSYVVPSGVVHGIKTVHPMFKGYSQQDSQEFLRCFMDQLHEELKQPVDHEYVSQSVDNINERPAIPSAADIMSDTDYETCDSGLSSERCSVEHGQDSPECDHPQTTAESLSCECAGGDADQTHLSFEQKIRDDKCMEGLKSSPSKESMVENDEIKGSEKDSFLEESSDHVEAMKPEVTRKGTTSRNISNLERDRGVGKRKNRWPEYRSIISDVFDGKILSTVQCLTCERISSTVETFQDLSLPIPNKDQVHFLHAQSAHKAGCSEVSLKQGWLSWLLAWMRSLVMGPTITLQDCLAAFFSADELKGDNMYSCEKCLKLRNGMKFSQVMKLPEVLCIHLKRFRHEFMFSSKISSYVSFPMESLDMASYLHKDCRDQVTEYELFAVICHHGTAGGGHYTSYGLNYLSQQWYEYDDQCVTEVDPQQVEGCEAYVLFYRKKNDAMLAARQDAQKLAESAECSLMKFFISHQWINKFNTFAEPGPIDSSDILCHHGGVLPSRWPYITEMVLDLPQSVWQLLYNRFGGGPAINHLAQCSTCVLEQEKLKKRQKYEMDTFVQLNSDFLKSENPGTIYAISMVWFKEWENFVRGRHHVPPDPVDNSTISVTKGSVVTLKSGSDYGQLSEQMWNFLVDIYGGGPPLVLRQGETDRKDSGRL